MQISLRRLAMNVAVILSVASAGLTCIEAAPIELQFASSSIRPNGSGNAKGAFGCHGTDTPKDNIMTKVGVASGKQPKVIPAQLGSCSATNTSLKMLIAFAYNLKAQPDQVNQRVLFGPAWAATDRFDLEAKAAAPATEADLRTMLQALLTDQFALQMRQESQDELGYVLVVAKGGAKLTAPTNSVPYGPDGVMTVISTSKQQTLSMHWARMSNFASFLTTRIGKPVVDQTNLTGVYDIKLVLAPINNGGGALAPLLTATQEQLGLRVDSQKISTVTVIIDNAEQPSGNRMAAAVPKARTVTSRANKTAAAPPKLLSCKPVQPGQSQTPAATAAKPASAVASNGQASMDLRAVLSRATDYVANYEASLGSVIGEEVYVQNANWKFPPHNKQQRTEADFAILKVGNSWAGVREVTCVDGVTVKKEHDFQRIFENASREVLLKTLTAISQESTGYNVGDIQRNTNLPTFALRILHPANLQRFKFNKDGEAIIGGARTWVVSFREIQTPTMIRDVDGRNEFANGVLWVEPESGRILRTELNVTQTSGPAPLRARTMVSYENNAKLKMLVPASMQEHYDTDYGHTLDCRADYFNFRRFQVEARFDFDAPPSLRPPP